MKKIILFFMLIPIVFSCSRDSSSEADNSSQSSNRKISKILVSDSDGTLNLSEIRFVYENNNLIQIQSKSKNGIVSQTNLIYENSKLVSANGGNSKFLFFYSGQTLSSIKYVNSPGFGRDATYNFTYDSNNKVNKVVCTGYYPDNSIITNQIVYDRDNISLSESKKNGQTNFKITNISYDNKNSPLRNMPFEIKMVFAITAEGYGVFSPYNEIFLSICDNNILNFKFGGESSNLYSSTVNYEYDNLNFPIKAENTGYASGKVTLNFSYTE